MTPLAEPALAAVADGRIKIVPERFEKIYNGWLENIKVRALLVNGLVLRCALLVAPNKAKVCLCRHLKVASAHASRATVVQGFQQALVQMVAARMLTHAGVVCVRVCICRTGV
jgi:hypothetical protein